jgi:hypothetical protein
VRTAGYVGEDVPGRQVRNGSGGSGKGERGRAERSPRLTGWRGARAMGVGRWMREAVCGRWLTSCHQFMPRLMSPETYARCTTQLTFNIVD